MAHSCAYALCFRKRALHDIASDKLETSLQAMQCKLKRLVDY